MKKPQAEAKEAREGERDLKEEIERLRRRLGEYESREVEGTKGARNDLTKPIRTWREEELKERNKNEVAILREVDDLLVSALETSNTENRLADIRRAIGVVRRRADLIFDAQQLGWSEAQLRRGATLDRSRLRCFSCGEEGHTVRECPVAKKRREEEREEQWRRVRQGRRDEKEEEDDRKKSGGSRRVEGGREEERKRDGGGRDRREVVEDGGVEELRERVDSIDRSLGEMMVLLRSVASGSGSGSDGREMGRRG